jgi:hypothetical protein
MIDFTQSGDHLLMRYVPERGSDDWLVKPLEKEEDIPLSAIVNPSGMIIMGRDATFTSDRRTDFEVIRRKFRHIVEIMTYDDLLSRLKVIRAQFESSVAP